MPIEHLRQIDDVCDNKPPAISIINQAAFAIISAFSSLTIHYFANTNCKPQRHRAGC